MHTFNLVFMHLCASSMALPQKIEILNVYGLLNYHVDKIMHIYIQTYGREVADLLPL